MASAGFLGEVTHASEMMRWAGPARYDLAGLYAFLKHGTYPVRVKYLPWRQPRSLVTSSATAPDATAPSAGMEGMTSYRPETGSLSLNSSWSALNKCSSDCGVCRSALGLHAAESETRLQGLDGAKDANTLCNATELLWTKNSALALDANADRVRLTRMAE